MSRWFRHYAGMMRDEKLVRVAVRAKQPVERVVWVWGAILESAAEINDGGRFEFDAGEAAYFLRCDEGELGSIVSTLGSMGRILDGVVVRWGDRQFDSDKSRDRQARYRERRKALRDDSPPVGDVTLPSRDGEMTLQETETELPDASASGAGAPSDPKADLFEEGSEIVQRWTGKSNAAARTFIGKLLKAASDDCIFVLSKIREAEADRRSDPIAWVSAAVIPRATDPPSKPKNLGAMFLDDARQLGMIHDNPSRTENGRMGESLGTRQGSGARLAGQPAIAADWRRAD